MEAFCAYLREQRPADAARKRTDGAKENVPFPSDLQAIVTAIGRRNRRHDLAARLPLAGIDLSGANFSVAHLEGAILLDAHLEGAKLRHSDVTQEQVDGAHGDTETRLPDGLTRPGRWTAQTHSNVASSEGGPSA